MLQIFTSLEYIITSNQTIFQWDGDSFKRATVSECPPLNSSQFVTKLCVCQGGAITECPLFSYLDGCQIDAPQRRAVIECRNFNYFQLAEFDIRQGKTTIECPLLNNCDARHDDSSQGSAAMECKTLDFFNILVTDEFND